MCGAVPALFDKEYAVHAEVTDPANMGTLEGIDPLPAGIQRHFLCLSLLEPLVDTECPEVEPVSSVCRGYAELQERPLAHAHGVGDEVIPVRRHLH